MQPEQAMDLYETVLRYAALPVLALVLWLCWVVTNHLMSPERRQARRNQQIKKAVAARQKRLAEARSAEDAENSGG